MGGGRAAWRRVGRRLFRPFGLLIGTVLVGGGAGLASFVHAEASRDETARVSMLFVEALADRQELLQRELYRMGEELHQMASLFETQAEVSREQFRAFARDVVSIFPQIYACEWAPRVEDSDRDDHERLARRDGVPGYRVVWREKSGELTATPPGSTHFPVFYAEPEDRNRRALGYDLSSEPVRAATMARALETGGLTLSEPIELVQQGSKAVLAVLAVAPRAAVSVRTSQAPAAGFVILVIRAQDLIGRLRLRAPVDAARMRFQLVATGLNGGRTRLAASPGWQDTMPSPVEWQRPIGFGGQQWLLSAQPTALFLAEHSTRQPLMLAAAAFLSWLTFVGLLLLVSKRAHDSARKRQDRVVRAAMTSLTEGVVVADADGRFLLFNEAAERILGMGLIQMDPAEWSDRYGCFQADGVTPFPSADLPLARALRGESSQEVEVLIRNPLVPEGAWISISGGPLVAVDDAPGGGVVTFRDITARKRTEAALQRSDEQRAHQEELARRLHNAVEQTADSVFITDRNGIIEYVNRGFEMTTGYSREEVVGQTPRVLKSGRHDTAHYQSLWKTILASEVYRSTHINRRKNGEEYYAEQTITPMIDSRGDLTHFVSVMKDVTERIRRQKREIEMEYAARVQQQLYPKQAPKWDEFDIAGAVFPASETGGDYFDYVVMRDDCPAVTIGDVCGHGLASALIMAETRAYIRSLAAIGGDPAEILTRINSFLFEHLADDPHYVTLLLARLDIAAGCVAYASAGHLDGFIMDGAGDMRAVLGSTGMPLGMFPEASCTSHEVAFLPGDVFVLLTDGVTEAESPDGRLFTAGDAINVVRAHRLEPAQAIIQHLRAAVVAFAEGQTLRDDLTIVICKALR